MRKTLFHPVRRRPSAPGRDLLAMQARKEVRLAHYERFFGPSFALSAQVEGAAFVDLLVFAPNPLKGRNHYTLATDGLSDLSRFSVNSHGSLTTLELIAYTPDLESAGTFALRLMRSVAQAMADPARALKAWAPVPAHAIDPAIPADAGARHLLILPPVREWPDFERRRSSDGSEVQFLWAVLLTPSEWKAAQAGREEFLARLKEAKPILFFDPSRPSIV